MKKWFYCIPALLLLLLTACQETETTDKYDNWEQLNQNFLDSLETVYAQQTPDAEGRKLKKLVLMTAPDDCIYYKEKTPVTDTDPNGGYEYLPGYVREDVKPTATDRVSVYYRGTLINGEYFDGFKGPNPTVSDQPLEAEAGSGIITGWQEVLQQMTVGERWEVYIPWKYGYGTEGSGSIPGYSVLIFDMQLYRIVSH